MTDPAELTLSATCNGKSSIGSEDNSFNLPVSAFPATVDLTVSVPAGSAVTVKRDGADVQLEWTTTTKNETQVLKSAIEVASADQLGTYEFFANGLTSVRLRLSPEQTLVDAPTSPAAGSQTVAEIEEGVYDAPFTQHSGWVVVAVVAAIVVAIWCGAGVQALPDVRVLGDDEWVSGTYAERAAFILLLVAAGAAAVLFVAGAWLAALETRGRLSRKAKVEQASADSGTRSAINIKDAGEAVSKVVDSLRWARGTVAVLAVAGIVMVAVIVAATIIAVNGDQRPAPLESSSSATPSDSPSSAEPSAPESSDASGSTSDPVAPGNPAQDPNNPDAVDDPADTTCTAEPGDGQHAAG